MNAEAIYFDALIKRTVADLAKATRLKPAERVLVVNATYRLTALALSRAAAGKETKAHLAETKAIKAMLLSLGEERAATVERQARDILRGAIMTALAAL
jgi:hypothetical protein